MKILVLFTGGTIGSSYQGDYIAPEGSNNYLLLELAKAEAGSLPECDTREVYSLLSENLDSEHLAQLCSQVQTGVTQGYDGIIVTHGSDTLQYSAAALGYALGNCSIPVVLVCSNYILTDERANGVENLLGAVRLITDGRAKGVFVSYANEPGTTYIHRATRLLAHEAYEHTVRSVQDSYYAVCRNGVITYNGNYSECDDELSPLAITSLDTGLVRFQPVYPGIEYPKADKEACIVLQGYHSGTLPTSSHALEEYVMQATVPVLLAGSSRDTAYESAAYLDRLGIQVVDVASPIAIYVKAWMLSQHGLDICENINKSLGGDIIKHN